MAQMEHPPTHWYDFLPVWWSVIAGFVTAVIGGIIRVERIALGQTQDRKDIEEVKLAVEKLTETVNVLPVVENDIKWIREHLEKRG
jgi:hypothetical protein